ncbi:signal peptidase I [Protaetiibacter mangrovi]|uniref:Signal peptidase I n=1 Tax=Protaetiibacter mangrovi TaxID=2970926 RepID=A0ABT1ZJH3_9MICO|nr:signal peptidase I [Protaetiibacter mangrovi]MCS0500740.1 signal peptidase I [Protaetiibacter mangrovi]TPX03728.1 signal peptidase I [Schumannella luteola]
MSLQTSAAPTVATRVGRGDRGRSRRLLTGIVFGVAGALGLLVLLAALAPLVGLRLVVLETGSMSPDHPAGSVLLDRDVAATEVGPGDIVTVTRPDGTPVTHRVVTVSRAGAGAALVLQGDANGQPDATPYLVTRVGLVVGGLPWGGALFALASSPGAVPVLAAAVSLLVLWAWWPVRPAPAHRNREA